MKIAPVLRRWAAPVGALCAVVTLAALVIGGAVAETGRIARDRETIRTHGRRLDDHDRRHDGGDAALVQIRTDLAEIKADVRWIRQELEGPP